MSFAVYLPLLIVGGFVVGGVVGLLVRRTSSEGMVPPILLGIIATLVLGLFLSEFAEASRLVALPAALVVAAIYVSRSALSDKHRAIGSVRTGTARPTPATSARADRRGPTAGEGRQPSSVVIAHSSWSVHLPASSR